MDSDPPPFHKKVIADETAMADRRNIGRMLDPGSFFLESEQAMGTEAGSFMPLLTLCLGLLLALTLGVIAARQRFGAALVWVVTTPVVITVAWFTTDVVMRLLPNLM